MGANGGSTSALRRGAKGNAQQMLAKTSTTPRQTSIFPYVSHEKHENNEQNFETTKNNLMHVVVVSFSKVLHCSPKSSLDDDPLPRQPTHGPWRHRDSGLQNLF